MTKIGMKYSNEIILLAGHGSRTEEEDGIVQVARHLHKLMHPDCKGRCVMVAYLQFMKPSISEAITAAVKKGADRIIVHPYFLTKGTHVTKSIPEIIAKAKKQYPDVEILYTAPLGAHMKIAQVVLEKIQDVRSLRRAPGERAFMNRVQVLGIGHRPLSQKAREALLGSDAVLATERLLDVFRRYDEYNMVRRRIKVLKDLQETKQYIRDNLGKTAISLLADGDPLFFGVGRVLTEEFGKDAVDIYPDLSSVQSAFSRIKETWTDALLISLHGGPDPAKRRKLKYEPADLPSLIIGHETIAVLTDNVNSPEVIAKILCGPSVPPEVRDFGLQMHVFEKLGYKEERITSGTPDEISRGSFSYPNVVIITRTKDAATDDRK